MESLFDIRIFVRETSDLLSPLGPHVPWEVYKVKATKIFCSNNGPDRRNGGVSDNESEDGEEGDYTVYECPGLAPVSYKVENISSGRFHDFFPLALQTGEMEVRNPMFDDDSTPKAGEGTK